MKLHFRISEERMNSFKGDGREGEKLVIGQGTRVNLERERHGECSITTDETFKLFAVTNLSSPYDLLTVQRSQ